MRTDRPAPIDWPAAFRSAALQVVIGVGVVLVALGCWWLAAIAMQRVAG
jgi:hypothetical protein